MPILFNTVLVPVDFSLNTDIAVKKAVSLIGAEKAVLHLLHVVSPGRSLSVWTAVKRLERWKDRIQREYPELQVKTHVLRGYFVQRLIIGHAKALSPDLIVVGKRQERPWWRLPGGISPRTLARKTNCPVLTVKPGNVDSRTKIIVIPISDRLPERKLEWGILLARKYKAQIHLLALREGAEDGQMQGVFLRAYHHLRESLRRPIEISTSVQHNPAKAALDYAEMVRADLILVNPETESWVGGLRWRRHISDLAEHNSGLQVLEVGM